MLFLVKAQAPRFLWPIMIIVFGNRIRARTKTRPKCLYREFTAHFGISADIDFSKPVPSPPPLRNTDHRGVPGKQSYGLAGKMGITPKQSNSIPPFPYMLSSVAVKILRTKRCAKNHPELPGGKSVFPISPHLKVNCGTWAKASVKKKKKWGSIVLRCSHKRGRKKMASAMDSIWLQFFHLLQWRHLCEEIPFISSGYIWNTISYDKL